MSAPNTGPTTGNNLGGTVPQEIEAIASAAQSEALAALSVARRRPSIMALLAIAVVGLVFSLAFVTSRAHDNELMASHRVDALVALERRQDSTIRADSVVRDSLVALAHNGNARLLAAANAADARERTTPTPRLRIVAANPGTPTPPNGTTGATTPDSTATGSLTIEPRQRSVSIDDSWRTVYVLPDSVRPHYVDGVIANVLDVLSHTAVEYAQFRSDARETVRADSAAFYADSVQIAELRIRVVTADSTTDATRALIPSRASRFWHDAKVIIGAAAVAEAIHAAVNILRSHDDLARVGLHGVTTPLATLGQVRRPFPSPLIP